MATSITTINSTDLITNSRADINNNFDSILVNKMETSVLSTDSTFAAASDSKIPSELAVKRYVDAGGNVNASETTKGIVEEATASEAALGTAVGATGARLYINPSAFPTLTPTKTMAVGTTTHALSATGAQTIAHGLGTTPTYVSIKAVSPSNQDAASFSWGEWYSGGYISSISVHQDEGGSSSINDDTLVSTSIFLRCVQSAPSESNDFSDATISVDATNITLTWSNTGTPTNTWNLVWLAKIDTITKS